MLPYPGEDVQGLNIEKSFSLGGQVEEKADFNRAWLYPFKSSLSVQHSDIYIHFHSDHI